MDGSSSLRVAFLAVALTVAGVRTDSTTARLPGYGGVLPVPAADTDAEPLDLVALRHLDVGAERGRVLYAAGHAPKPVDRATASARSHRICPQQVVQTRAGVTGPTT